MNNDQPGVIGQIGTILGKHDINIANFALGRSETGAVAAVNVDEPADKKIGENVMKEIRGAEAREERLVGERVGLGLTGLRSRSPTEA